MTQFLLVEQTNHPDTIQCVGGALVKHPEGSVREWCASRARVSFYVLAQQPSTGYYFYNVEVEDPDTAFEFRMVWG